jgi:hypothetical protein
MSNAPSATGDSVGTNHTARDALTERDTVDAVVPGLPMVAATPVRIAEVTAFAIPKPFLEPARSWSAHASPSTHFGASKVGVEFAVEATPKACEKKRVYFDITIKGGDRNERKPEHTGAAASLQKLTVAPG